MKTVLKDIAEYTEIPRAPPHNNYRGDGKKEQDKVVKAWANAQLNSLRMLATAYQKEDKTLMEQCWQLQAVLYKRMVDYRKECSLPGSSGGPHAAEDMLFTKEELNNIKQRQREHSEGQKYGWQQANVFLQHQNHYLSLFLRFNIQFIWKLQQGWQTQLQELWQRSQHRQVSQDLSLHFHHFRMERPRWRKRLQGQRKVQGYVRPRTWTIWPMYLILSG